jgi:hypothetical protein
MWYELPVSEVRRHPYRRPGLIDEADSKKPAGMLDHIDHASTFPKLSQVTAAMPLSSVR